jgi:hypothetical protein
MVASRVAKTGDGIAMAMVMVMYISRTSVCGNGLDGGVLSPGLQTTLGVLEDRNFWKEIPRELARAFTIIAVVHTDSALGSFSLNNGDTTDEESLSEADLAFLLWGLINPPNKEHRSRMYEYGCLDTTIHLT